VKVRLLDEPLPWFTSVGRRGTWMVTDPQWQVALSMA
jgi:hypothetical protein